MSFEDYWKANWTPNQQMPRAFDAAMREIAEKAWVAAIATERAACASVANQQILTSWNAETDSHNRCAELIRNLVLMRSNVEGNQRPATTDFQEGDKA